MTAEDWEMCTSAHMMTHYLRSQRHLQRTKNGRRKLRLFACACGRRILQLLTDRRGGEAIEIAEQFADGLVPTRVLNEARFHVNSIPPQGITDSEYDAHSAACTAIHTLCDSSTSDALRASDIVERALRLLGLHEMHAHTAYLRDIFGNPFRPVALDPRWLSATVRDLARTIYDDRNFEILPILADALMDAGCDSEEIFSHCRSDGPHVRGCWVVDLLLGKE